MLGKRLNKGDFERNINVGQALPDNRKNIIENNSCVAVPVLQPYGEGSEQQLLRTSALFNCQVKPDLHINYKGSPSPLVGRRCPGRFLSGSARRAGEGFLRAFTLIELLVVILIIGILAAVALPQYQLVVKKVQFSKLRTSVELLGRHVQNYYLANGDWPHSFDDFDSSLPNMAPVKVNVTAAACIQNEEMFCCLLRPVKNSSNGSIGCGTSIMSVGYRYANSNSTKLLLRRVLSCTDSDDTFCKTLPGAKKSHGSVLRPTGWVSNLYSYELSL